MGKIVRWLGAVIVLLASLVPVMAQANEATPVGDPPADASDVGAAADTAEFTITVTMSDAGPFPEGMAWSIDAGLGAGNPGGSIPAGDTSYVGTAIDIPEGTYSIWVTGPGISVGQAFQFDQVTESYTVAIDRFTSTLQINVDTDDGNPLPVGTTWEVLDSALSVVGSGTLTSPVPDGGSIANTVTLGYGTYTVTITNSGYADYSGTMQAWEWNRDPASITASIGQVPATESTVTLVIDSSDGPTIPAGTQWAIGDQSGTLAADETAPYTIVLADPVPVGQSTVLVRTPADIFYHYAIIDIAPVAEQTFTVTVTDTSKPEDNFATITIGLRTVDGSAIPPGTRWHITDSSGEIVLFEGTIPGGTASPTSVEVPEQLNYGQYIIEAWTGAYIHYSGQVINVNTPTFFHELVFEHNVGTLGVTVETQDGSDIPAGTAWELVNEDGVVEQSGTFATDTVSGAALPLANPTDYGLYELNVTSGSSLFTDYSTTVVMDQANVNVVATLGATTGTVELTLTTEDGGDIPTGAIVSVGGITQVVPAGETSAAAIPSGTTLTFTNVPEGDQTVSVTNADPYLDASTTATVVGGEAIDVALQLQVPDVEPTPTAPIVANPPGAGTGDPDPSDDGGDDSDDDGSDGDDAGDGNESVDGDDNGASGGPVTSLPSTGQGTTAGSSMLLVTLGAMLALVMGAAAVRIRTRR